MSQPVCTYTTTFPNAGQTKLSYVSPYNTLTVTVTPDQNLTYFVANATFGSDECGPGVGKQIAEFSTLTANTSFNFTITANNHLLEGSGIYRIGLYAQNSSLEWNWEYFFLTVGGDNFKTSLSEDFLVIAKGYLVTIKAFSGTPGSATELLHPEQYLSTASGFNAYSDVVPSGGGMIMTWDSIPTGCSSFSQWYNITDSETASTANTLNLQNVTKNTVIGVYFT